MPEGWKTLTIREEVYNKINEFHQKQQTPVKFNPWVSDYLLMSIEKDEFLKEYAPFLSKIGIEGNRITIRDDKTKKYADVYLKDHSLFCELDNSDSCIHVRFALALPELSLLK